MGTSLPDAAQYNPENASQWTFFSCTNKRRTATVGMPVTRPPPYRPGRAVFPHPVLRLYSRPRCKAKPAGTPAPPWHFRNTRPRYLDAIEAPGKLLPGITTPLASASVAPLVRTGQGPSEKAVERASVPTHAIVIGVAS